MTKTDRINLKAKKLVDKFKPHADWNNDYGSSEPQANLKHAKQCALICIEEQLKMLSNIDTSFNDDIAEEVYQAEKELELIKQRIKS